MNEKYVHRIACVLSSKGCESFLIYEDNDRNNYALSDYGKRLLKINGWIQREKDGYWTCGRHTIMIKLSELEPGDKIEKIGVKATYIGRMNHPILAGRILTIWRFEDGTITLDALWPTQEVGELISTKDERSYNLTKALNLNV